MATNSLVIGKITNDRLGKGDGRYFMCDEEEEDSLHIFLKCNVI